MKSLSLYSGPSAFNPSPNAVILPGSTFVCSAKWTQRYLLSEAYDYHPIFLKLKEERLWVNAKNVETGEKLVQQVANP
jgi:hypothetical protein